MKVTSLVRDALNEFFRLARADDREADFLEYWKLIETRCAVATNGLQTMYQRGHGFNVLQPRNKAGLDKVTSYLAHVEFVSSGSERNPTSALFSDSSDRRRYRSGVARSPHGVFTHRQALDSTTNTKLRFPDFGDSDPQSYAGSVASAPWEVRNEATTTDE